MPEYRKYPSDGPSRRGVWWLVVILVALVVVNVVERTF
jgi:hypothetical protein